MDFWAITREGNVNSHFYGYEPLEKLLGREICICDLEVLDKSLFDVLNIIVQSAKCILDMLIML